MSLVMMSTPVSCRVAGGRHEPLRTVGAGRSAALRPTLPQARLEQPDPPLVTARLLHSGVPVRIAAQPASGRPEGAQWRLTERGMVVIMVALALMVLIGSVVLATTLVHLATAPLDSLGTVPVVGADLLRP